MKTIAQALKDEIHYPLPDGFVENRLICRGYEPGYEVSPEILTSNEFQGAVADCLYSLVIAPNISEADKSVTLPDPDRLLEQANSIYRAIGEDERLSGVPQVSFGWH